ncbi:MAG: DUF134 domain-containing protein [Campylobacterales bacterium]|nr:DUF134 domain-containing protein [Campylobacterales bacterium]
MGRQKIKRACSFKPLYTLFAPENVVAEGEMELNSDEMEAIYLMDYESMYQEDAAREMNVSRPTFSRIIKSARTKIATALVRGYRMRIVDAKDKFIVALPVLSQTDFSSFPNAAPWMALVQLANQKVVAVTFVSNPAASQKPSACLPDFLKSHGVSYYLGARVGEGLKNILLARGIFVKKIPPLNALEEIPTHICKCL